MFKLASTTLVAGDHYTYINTFMARHVVAIDLIRKLALAVEEGITMDGADPNLNIDLHYLFTNFTYGQCMETTFYSPHLKGSSF